jgi:hypothetical protein
MIREPKFVPGPWSKNHDHVNPKTAASVASIRPVRRPEDYHWGDVAVVMGCGDEVQNANAHLITAAPRLYDALAGLLKAHRSTYPTVHAMEFTITEAETEADAALAEARGES